MRCTCHCLVIVINLFRDITDALYTLFVHLLLRMSYTYRSLDHLFIDRLFSLFYIAGGASTQGTVTPFGSLMDSVL